MGIVGFLAFSGAAFAEGINWTYIEAGYNNVDLDDLDDDGDGWFAGGKFAIGDSYHITARYDDNTTDDTDADLSTWHLGAGWHGLFGDGADLFGEVAYVDREFGDFDGSGWFGRAGVRWRPISLLEVGAGARWEDLGGDIDDSDTIWEANALIYVWKLGIGLSYETQDEVDTYNGFVRFNFGGD
ncbi:MAG: hypothetical protein GY716_13020 [bacterium]|nr:hypothetical protein [bacterium]